MAVEWTPNGAVKVRLLRDDGNKKLAKDLKRVRGVLHMAWYWHRLRCHQGNMLTEKWHLLPSLTLTRKKHVIVPTRYCRMLGECMVRERDYSK